MSLTREQIIERIQKDAVAMMDATGATMTITTVIGPDSNISQAVSTLSVEQTNAVIQCVKAGILKGIATVNQMKLN